MPAESRHSGAIVSPVMQELSAHIAGALGQPLPEEVRDLARLHLVDACASILSGSAQLPGRRGIAYVRSLGGARESSVFGTAIVTNAVNAALANGMSAHADETDGSHPPTISHPDASLVPAAIALCERQGLSGTDLLRSIVLGYDVGARVLLTLDPIPFLMSGHFAASFGQLFAATAASAALLRLDGRQVRHALSYAAQQAAGTFTQFRDTEHVEKAFGMGGMPAQNGVAATLMVAHGCTGVDDVFSGERDFFFTFAPTETVDRTTLIRGLGREYEISRAAIKRWSAGGPIQAPLDLLSEVIARHDLTAPDVEKIIIRLQPKLLEAVNDRAMTDISLQHLVAVMLADGDLSFASSHDVSRAADPVIAGLRAKVEALGDDRFTHARCASMEIRLTSGRVLKLETMAAKGSYENPMTEDEVGSKARDLVEPVLGKVRTARLLDFLWRIDGVEDLRVLRRYIRA